MALPGYGLLMRQLGNSKGSTSVSISQAVTVLVGLNAGLVETISQLQKGRQNHMPNSLDKLMEAYEELVQENNFLKVKAQYFKQSCTAMDISLNVARKQIVELKSDMRVMKASAI